MAITLTVRHQVRDYDVWRPASTAMHRSGANTASPTSRCTAAPTTATVFSSSWKAHHARPLWPSVSDPSLKLLMERSGVISEPTVVIGEILAAQPV